MSYPERPQPPRKKPADVFGLSEQEQLYYRLSNKRFQQMLDDEQTTIHDVHLDSNNYGEFLFVTTSREVEGRQYLIVFYGLGFHEQRERWYTDEWYWYEMNPISRLCQQQVDKGEALRLIQARRDEIAAQATDTPPSERAMLFALLADLTDEDAASMELEDLESLPFGEDE